MPQFLHKRSACKVNLLLNILGKRADGFHELETLMHPVQLFDELEFSVSPTGVELTCNDIGLPTDSRNLVHRAATAFLSASGITSGLKIHLEKRIPQAAGLGGGSGNAAITLSGLNELFGLPLTADKLHDLAARLGSDIPFFLQQQPALAIGRGEQIIPLPAFPALKEAVFVLVHPGFGIATAWAYKELARFPTALNGERGRANRLAQLLQMDSLDIAGRQFYNSLEGPALEKYPILALYQECFRENGAPAALMSGSGSTTFAVARNQTQAEQLVEAFRSKFGDSSWIAMVPNQATN